jgi:hypothetical protein
MSARLSRDQGVRNSVTEEETDAKSEDGDLIKVDDDDDEAREVPPDPAHRFKHRDALEKAILKTREEYLGFHLENPGFFMAVVDSADFDRSKAELYEMAKALLKEFGADDSSKYPLVNSHAGMDPKLDL